ncbi:MAG: ABC-2 family transporter protein [Chloroflexi bacterium]|nr:ABC-2 family transporter protein [Chloroflexota bacterium]
MQKLAAIYHQQFTTEMAVVTQYRISIAIWILSLVTEPIVYMTVWTTITLQQGAVGGYTTGDFAAYYITWMLVRHFAVTLSPDALEWRVRQGEFSQLLLKPIHPIHTDIASNIAYKLIALPIILGMMLALATLFPPTYNLQLWSILAFIPVMLMAYLIRFLSHWILGLLAFWMTRARSFFEIFFVAEIFLTGRLAPLALLPLPIMVAASVLPFRWMIAFPVELLLGKVSPIDALIGFGMQVIWLGLEIILLMIVWRAGVRRYGAVGA